MAEITPSGNIEDAVRKVTCDPAMLRNIKLICKRLGYDYSRPEGVGDALGYAINLLSEVLQEIPCGSDSRLAIVNENGGPIRLFKL